MCISNNQQKTNSWKQTKSESCVLRTSCAAAQSWESIKSLAHLRERECASSLSPDIHARLAAVFSDITSPFLATILAASKLESAAR